MSLDKTHPQYRDFLRGTCWYEHAHQEDAKELAYLTLGLVGEAGEFADEFKKVVREAGFDNRKGFDELMSDGHQAKLEAELGDVLWYLTRLCDLLGVSLEQLMFMNTYKLFNRIKSGEWAPPMEIKWPFTSPMHSFNNVQMNLFPEDSDGDDNVC